MSDCNRRKRAIPTNKFLWFSARQDGQSGTMNLSYATPSRATCASTLISNVDEDQVDNKQTSPSGFVLGFSPVRSISSAYAFHCGFAIESLS